MSIIKYHPEVPPGSDAAYPTFITPFKRFEFCCTAVHPSYGQFKTLQD